MNHVTSVLPTSTNSASLLANKAGTDLVGLKESHWKNQQRVNERRRLVWFCWKCGLWPMAGDIQRHNDDGHARMHILIRLPFPFFPLQHPVELGLCV